MIYGYLRVSTDKQDIDSQRQGVDGFAEAKGWTIDEYITDEGVSGGKDPDKRNLGPLLKKLHEGDIVIASEISRLGRDLYMVMDILHLCMTRGCKVYTVKDRFTLGDDISSKVLAFAFGLSAEIERQMIRQRTKEGLRLRMKLGVLVGRPVGRCADSKKYGQWRDKVAQMVEWQMTPRQIAEVVGCDRGTASALVALWKLKGWKYSAKARPTGRDRSQKYKEGAYKVVPLDRDETLRLIAEDKTIPQIAEQFPQYSYEQVYDSILCDEEFNTEYRKHGQKLVKREHY